MQHVPNSCSSNTKLSCRHFHRFSNVRPVLHSIVRHILVQNSCGSAVQTQQQHRRSCRQAAQRRRVHVNASTNINQEPSSRAATRRDCLIVPPVLVAACAAGGCTFPSHAQAQAAAVPAVAAVPKTTIAPGLTISKVIKGCWQLDGYHRGDPATDRTRGASAIADLELFYRAGINTFDTADIYGPSELIIGDYFKTKPGRFAECPVLTKYCVFDPAEMLYLSRSMVLQAINRSRNRLGKGTLDLVHFFWSDYRKRKYVDAGLYLMELVEQGLIRHLGVTNFDTPRLQRLLDNDVRIVSSQVQYSLFDRRPENYMSDFCAKKGIAMLPYGVLAGGLLSGKYVGAPASSGVPDTASKEKYLEELLEFGTWKWLQLLLKVLDDIAKKHNVSVSNVASRWVLQRPNLAAIVLGARNPAHIQDHQQLFTFSLDADDEGRIQEVLARAKPAYGDCYTWERGGIW